MSAVTIIGPDYSSYVRSIILALELKGVSYDRHMNGMTDIAELKSEKHLSLHPFAKVPVLIHGDNCIFESAAILEYIDESFVGANLMSGSPAEFAKQRAWVQSYICYAYDPIFKGYLIPLLRRTFPKDKSLSEFSEAAFKRIQPILEKFENAYENAAPFYNGSQPELIDMLLVIMLDYLNMSPLEQDISREFPKLKNMFVAYREREDFAATIPESFQKSA
ncbi:MAG: glutathione S-transferase family protein [Alphaproteobacteria bacterium]|nr:glutathione S-transferase family protein [Alphaproteobacteria bacterium]